jgi:hypothetical protein
MLLITGFVFANTNAYQYDDLELLMLTTALSLRTDVRKQTLLSTMRPNRTL